MNEQAKQLMAFSVLPLNDNALTFNDRLLVMDTLESKTTLPGIADNEGHFPMKLASTCLLIVMDGSVKVKMNLSDLTASANDCIAISYGTIIQGIEIDDYASVIQLSFSYKQPAPGTALQTALWHLKPEHITTLKNCYTMLRTILADSSFALNRESLAFNCIELMVNIAAQGADNQSDVTTKVTRRDEIVTRFLDCVNRNYREHRELSLYAGQLQLSLKYMSHVIYKQTGRHPAAWIRDHVILDAKAMLRSGRYSVQQVAAELNFPNQSFFGKYFKEAVGVSPKKWK